MKVLIADDSPVARATLVRLLESQLHDSHLTLVSDGAQALTMVGAKSFDLIMLDWNMPSMEGIDVLRAIRAQQLNVPVIMVTGEKDREHVLAAFEAGANDYIHKVPWNPKQVVAKVKRALEKSKTKAVAKPTGPLAALIADDSKVIRKILASTLAKKCDFANVVQACDGKEAVDAAKQGHFGLILLDWNMPNMLGIDALRAIRAAGNETPVIMVTSEAERVRVIEAFDVGANNYIIKPFTPELLTEKINQVLYIHA